MNFLTFWTVIGGACVWLGGAAWGALSSQESPATKWARRVTLIGVALLLVCGSMLALAKDLTS